MKIYKVIRSSGYFQTEECGHEHGSIEEAEQCLQEILKTSPHHNWIVSAPLNSKSRLAQQK